MDGLSHGVLPNQVVNTAPPIHRAIDKLIAMANAIAPQIRIRVWPSRELLPLPEGISSELGTVINLAFPEDTPQQARAALESLPAFVESIPVFQRNWEDALDPDLG